MSYLYSNIIKINIHNKESEVYLITKIKNENETIYFNISILDLKNLIIFKINPNKNKSFYCEINKDEFYDLKYYTLNNNEYINKEKVINSFTTNIFENEKIRFFVENLNENEIILKINEEINKHFNINIFSINLLKVQINENKIFKIIKENFDFNLREKNRIILKNEDLRYDILNISEKNLNILLKSDLKRIKTKENMIYILNNKKKEIIKMNNNEIKIDDLTEKKSNVSSLSKIDSEYTLNDI